MKSQSASGWPLQRNIRAGRLPPSLGAFASSWELDSGLLSSWISRPKSPRIRSRLAAIACMMIARRRGQSETVGPCASLIAWRSQRPSPFRLEAGSCSASASTLAASYSRVRTRPVAAFRDAADRSRPPQTDTVWGLSPRLGADVSRSTDARRIVDRSHKRREGAVSWADAWGWS